MQGSEVGSRRNKLNSSVSIHGLGEDYLKAFCKRASVEFFEKYGLISHQINSYNDFIKNGILKVFDSVGEIIAEADPSVMMDDGDRKSVIVKFGNIRIQRPMFWPGAKFSDEHGTELLKLLPRHARLQKMTYSASMKVETHVQIYTNKLVRKEEFSNGAEYVMTELEREYKKVVLIGRIPVMVRSKLCWMSGAKQGDCDYDHGGYFIVKGAEKIFIAQEQLCMARLWLSGGKNWMVQYRPVEKSKRVYMKLEDTSPFKAIGGGEKTISLSFAFVEMPVWILFFALGVSSDKEVVNLIDIDIEDTKVANTLIASIYDADKKCDDFRKGKNALNYIDILMKSTKFPPTESVDECIKDLLFPNLQGFKQKARFLGYMVKCLLEVYTGRRKTDNKDDFRNKRLELANELLARELKVQLKNAQRRIVKALQKDLDGNRELQSIEHYIDASIVTNGLSRAFSTGAWAHPLKGRVSGGVVTDLLRTNPLQSIAEMRKTRLQVSYSRRVGDARYPHLSHWGKVCFLSTPDGENCGLVKNLASLGLVSITNVEPLLDKVFACGMKELVDDPSVLPEEHKIFLDGEWVGTCQNPESFVERLRSMRRSNKISHQVEIKMDKQNKEVRIFSDAGRILRPLLNIENVGKIRALMRGKGYSFQSLMESGIIELIGPEEEEDCVTAWDVTYLFNKEQENPPRRYTHCELDMSFVLGFSCGLIPYANHNNVKRVIYESQKHSHQAIGFSTTNPSIRTDTNIHQLYYPQMPLFRTALSECLGKSTFRGLKQMLPHPEYYNGQCAIVAVNVHLGYNQEDSLVMNRASLERGMFRSEHVRSYRAEANNEESFVTMPEYFGKIQKPQNSVKRGADKLDDDGFPYIGAKLNSGDIIIGKYAKSETDNSVKLKHAEKGTVQKVLLSANDDGKNFAVVSLRQVRSPSLGDKFASMHGQKGVLGFLESQENFPFTREGIVPDIVINPHAFPSRQSPGQLLETALGKSIAVGGELKYATPFTALSVDAVGEQLMSYGFSKWGNEKVLNGHSGEMMKSLVFIGPTFYQRLTHMAEDKVKFRTTGPVNPHTRQPVADRKRSGGVKFGEMERDSLLAHGASANLFERCFTLSDSSQIYICRNCRNMATLIQRPGFGGLKIRRPYCKFCMSEVHIAKANVPHGAKLLVQELLSMNIHLKFDTDQLS